MGITSLSAGPKHVTFDQELHYLVYREFRVYSMVKDGEITEAVLIAKDGEAWKVEGFSDAFPKRSGQIDVPIHDGEPVFPACGIFQAEAMDRAPSKVVAQLW